MALEPGQTSSQVFLIVVAVDVVVADVAVTVDNVVVVLVLIDYLNCLKTLE